LGRVCLVRPEKISGMLGDRIRDAYDKAAKERQRIRKGNQPGASVQKSSHLTYIGKSRDQAGRAVGVLGWSIDQARHVRRDRRSEVAQVRLVGFPKVGFSRFVRR
jgi:hypothetical protein